MHYASFYFYKIKDRLKMYEQFKHQLVAKLATSFTIEQLKTIVQELDVVANAYTISAAKQVQVTSNQQEMANFIQIYIVSRGMEGLSKLTLSNYWLSLKSFASFMRKPIKDITPNDVRLYLYAYQQSNGISNRSLDATRSCLSTFFQWLVNEKYLAANPMANIKPIKYEAKPREALSQIELEYLRRACSDKREIAILEVFYSTGCRVSELTGIKLSDINWGAHSLTLLGKGNKHRTSYLNAKAEVAIREYVTSRKHESEYLFCNDRGGTQMTKSNVERIMRKITERSGLQGKRVSPHILRHTTATQALRSGMPVQDVQQLLGHANISTTMIYASTCAESIAAGHRKFVV